MIAFTNQKIELSLVVATYRRPEQLNQLLDSLAHQSLPRNDWELIVCVDELNDRETIATLEVWKRNNLFALTYFCQKNSGQSIARHRAIEQSHGSHIVVVDDDMELSPDFLKGHLSASRKFLGCTVVIGKVVPERHWTKEPLYEALRTEHMLKFHERLEAGQEPSASAFVTQNVSFPKSLYSKVGGFDFSFRLDEDRELGMRLERAGAQFVFSPEASAIHHSHIGSYEKWYQRQYEYGKYAVLAWQKLDHDPFAHPLRNLVTGSRLNAIFIHLFSPNNCCAKIIAAKLRILGIVLKLAGFMNLALATHKAILAIQYHRGVKDQLGSWKALLREKESFKCTKERPYEPTGKGPTHGRNL